MNKIVFFTKYTPAGASSRYRVYQYLPYFKEAGFKTSVKPLFTDEYIGNLFGRKRISRTYVLRRYWRRIMDVMRVSNNDLVYIEYELLPYFPAWLELLLKVRGIPYVVDYDDAIFHTYDSHPNRIIRKLFSGKIPWVMKNAQTVITGSEYLTNFATRFNSSVIEIPTSLNIDKYKGVEPVGKNESIFTIGWIGSPTNSRNIIDILPVFKRFFKTHAARLILVGFDTSLSGQFKNLPVEFLNWNEANEIGIIRSFDVGIMPLEEMLFTKGKCGFKLIQYMASGIPTISTALPANININKDKLNLITHDHDEWVACLDKVFTQREYYKEVGKSNIQLAEIHYSIQSNHKIFIDIFSRIKKYKATVTA